MNAIWTSLGMVARYKIHDSLLWQNKENQGKKKKSDFQRKWAGVDFNTLLVLTSAEIMVI